MANSYLSALDELLNKTEKKHQVSCRDGGWSFVTGPDGAIGVMRELAKINAFSERRVSYDADQDSMLRFRNVPLRIRHGACIGMIGLHPDAEIPERGCCDAACMQTIMIASSGGSA